MRQITFPQATLREHTVLITSQIWPFHLVFLIVNSGKLLIRDAFVAIESDDLALWGATTEPWRCWRCVRVVVVLLLLLLLCRYACGGISCQSVDREMYTAAWQVSITCVYSAFWSYGWMYIYGTCCFMIAAAVVLRLFEVRWYQVLAFVYAKLSCGYRHAKLLLRVNPATLNGAIFVHLLRLGTPQRTSKFHDVMWMTCVLFHHFSQNIFPFCTSNFSTTYHRTHIKSVLTKEDNIILPTSLHMINKSWAENSL